MQRNYHRNGPPCVGFAFRAANPVSALVTIALLLGSGGLLLWRLCTASRITEPIEGVGNVHFWLVSRTEPVAIALSVAFVAVCAIVLMLGCGDRHRGTLVRAVEAVRPWQVGTFVFLACAIGHGLCIGGFPLSMDEFAATFQAKVFARGEWKYRIPEAWWPVSGACTPIYVTLERGAQSWHGTYFPMHALLATPFYALGGASFLFNALMATAGAWLLGKVSERLYPGDAFARGLCLLLYAGSSQILVMGMSFYAMPSHLACNLLWLWLFFGSSRARLLCPLVGFIGIGLHNPAAHLAFAFPLCCGLLFERRWAMAGYMAGAYGVAAAFWYAFARWWSYFSFEASAIPFGFNISVTVPMQVTYLVQTITWNHLFLGVFVILCLRHARALGWNERLLLCGAGFVAVFYGAFLMPQGHGWGYRYIFPVLGNLILLAPAAWRMIPERRVAPGALVAFWLATVAAVVIALPIRCRQAYEVVGPYRRAWKYLSGLRAEAVVIDADRAWHGKDLVRNLPDPEWRPMIFREGRMAPGDLRWLEERFGVVRIPPEALEKFGLRVRSVSGQDQGR